MKNSLLILTHFVLAFAFCANAQVSIDNVSAKQSHNTVTVTYDLSSTDPNGNYFVQLTIAGENEQGPFLEIRSLTGDVGSGVKAGKERSIVWNVFRDFETIPFKNIRFRIDVLQLPGELKGFTYVHGGSFVMGSDEGEEDARPAHQISVNDFYIGKYEVTVSEYQAFCKETGKTFPAEKIEWLANHPMTFVNWYDAVEYCDWLKNKTQLPFRLLTEAEWEYAAKGGAVSQEFAFSGSNNINDVGWYKQNSVGVMHNAVGKLRPNELNIHDMSGNVWEWCSDWYNSKYYSFSSSKDPAGPAAGKVKVGRGGSWFNRDVKSDFRYFMTPTSKTNYVGFRVACSASETKPQLLVSTTTKTYEFVLTEPPVAKRAKSKPPKIEIIDPKVGRGEVFSLFNQEVVVKGRVTSDAGILMVLVNGNETRLDAGGYFEKSVRLQYADNMISVKAYDVFNTTSSDSVKVYRMLNKDDAVAQTSHSGTNYALLIGTNSYKEFAPLSNPVFDVETIQSELTANYNFNVEKILNPSQEEFYNTLRNYSKRKFNPEDQLFIFVAGHGVFDNLFGDGYVVLSDSRKDDQNKTSYISHSNLRTILNNIECNHVFLILDVCFGGTFDPTIAKRGSEDYEKAGRTEFIKRKLKYKSRLYLTSGGKEYVSDGQPGRHSPFAREFLTALRSFGGADKILTVSELLTYIEKARPEPRFGEFGDNEPGSDFLFLAR